MRILIATDAWSPQVNGVVRTLNAVILQLRRAGHEIVTLTPEGRSSWAMPFYDEIDLTLITARSVSKEVAGARPDAIHIATEGPIGWAARRACLRLGLPFTTSFHTRFAEYAAMRLPLPGIASLGWAILRQFHRPSSAVMVPTPTIARDLERRGFAKVRVWTRGADHSLFRPYSREYLDLPRPILLYAGRLSVEKGITSFLTAEAAGTKVLLGDGPERAELQRRFPQAVYLGFRHGEDYARSLAAADVLVFPSKTDTFGLVMLEAMACGTPVAAYNVASPIDVVSEGVTGSLAPDLATAIAGALQLDRTQVAQAARAFSWERTASLFESWLQPIDPKLLEPNQAPALLPYR